VADEGALFVPGRLCLFGEHSDWAGGHRRTHPEISPGHCLVAGTDQGLTAEAAPADSLLEIESTLATGETLGPLQIDATTEALLAAASRATFFSYAAGTAAEVAARYDVGGLSLRIRSDLPAQVGLSSSAATCVLIARAYSRTYALGLSVEEEMELAYRGERRTGSECGRMDPVCALGRGVTSLTFDGDAFDIERVVLGGTLHLLIVDLRRSKDTRRILRDLNACFPDAPGPLAAGVREALGGRNREVHRRARAALESGDPVSLGALMTESQAIFDRDIAPACSELAAPRLHALLAHSAVAELAWGAKGVGSQGDGCGQIVARGEAERTALARRLEDELEVGCLPLDLTVDLSNQP
jgi:galactokinase